MNSIRPITFVEAPLLASATFAVAALAVVFLGLTQSNAALRDGAARGFLARAEAMPRGMERDAALSKAIIAIDDAVQVAPQDASVHALAARAYYLQATTAQVDDVSAPLLDAARRAAEESLARSGANASATAVLALVETARNGPAAAFVARSYAVPASADGALWRLEAAVRAWPTLDLPLREAIIADSCMRASGEAAFAAQVAQAATLLPDAGFDRCLPAPAAPLTSTP